MTSGTESLFSDRSDLEGPWSFRDLEDGELVHYTTLTCECKPPAESGTRHGYTCPRHRAQAEIDRRAGHFKSAINAYDERNQP